MTSVANAALPHPLAVFGRSAARAVIAPVPRRPTVREAGVDRDDKVAPGIDIDAFRRGDFDTFRTVLQHFGPLIQVIAAAHTGNAHDREELFQEITVRLWERRAQYSARGPLGGWINRIAHPFLFRLDEGSGDPGGGGRAPRHRSARAGRRRGGARRPVKAHGPHGVHGQPATRPRPVAAGSRNIPSP